MAEEKGRTIDESGAEVAATRRSIVEQMRDQMDLEASIVGGANAREIINRIQETILSSEDDDAVFAAADISLPSAETFVDVPTLILDFNYAKSSYAADGGLPAFAIVLGLNLDTGEEITYSIGAESAVAQLHRWEQIERFTSRTTLNDKDEKIPGFPVALKGKPTASGYTALLYRPLTPAERKRGGLKETAKK